MLLHARKVGNMAASVYFVQCASAVVAVVVVDAIINIA